MSGVPGVLVAGCGLMGFMYMQGVIYAQKGGQIPIHIVFDNDVIEPRNYPHYNLAGKKGLKKTKFLHNLATSMDVRAYHYPQPSGLIGTYKASGLKSTLHKRMKIVTVGGNVTKEIYDLFVNKMGFLFVELTDDPMMQGYIGWHAHIGGMEKPNGRSYFGEIYYGTRVINKNRDDVSEPVCEQGQGALIAQITAANLLKAIVNNHWQKLTVTPEMPIAYQENYMVDL